MMAFFEMRFQSHQLGQGVTVNVIMPDVVENPVKTLWLFHGLSDDHNAWMDYSSIYRYASQHGIAVVMPCSDRGWYTDTAFGKNYFTFVTRELVDTCRKFFPFLSTRREDNMVAGLSMGGYGALKAALTYPEQYGYCGSLSGWVNITRKDLPCSFEEWQGVFGYDLQDVTQLKDTKHDLLALVKTLKKEQREIPHIYLWCGTEDYLIDENKTFTKQLQDLDVPHECLFSEGDHSWPWWDQHIQDILTFFLKK